MNKQAWTEERAAALVGLVGTDTSIEVSKELQKAAADQLGVTVRSISSKLRNMDYQVASNATKRVAAYTPEQEEELRAFVESNAEQFTYTEIAKQVLDGTKNAKEIQGKLLSMDLFTKVKPTPKVEAAKKYSEDEEVKFLALMAKGSFLEEIAEAMDRPLNSVRGKALSLTRANPELSMPKQKESHASTVTNPLEGILDKIGDMTVAEIAEEIGKTERGVKTMLTRRSLTANDYDGNKKAAKAAKVAEAA